MKAIIQRVKKAVLSVDNEVVSEIGKGLIVYLGVGKGDSEEELKWFAKKTARLRIFEDGNGKMNLSAFDLDLDVLVVSQFTLYGDIKNGYRPGFGEAEKPEIAKEKYQKFMQELGQLGIKKVLGGVFGADMNIKQENYGPVTIIIDTASRKKGNKKS